MCVTQMNQKTTTILNVFRQCYTEGFDISISRKFLSYSTAPPRIDCASRSLFKDAFERRGCSVAAAGMTGADGF